jgi:glycerophosphoryl diester phosphodiesterase
MNRAHTIKARPSRDHDRGFFSPPLPRIFAHRGLAIGAPENTLLAFLKAMSAGATHIETDVHATLDGVAVISHDPDLARLVGRNARVEQFTMAELRRIDLGDGQSFVSLHEALDAFPDILFNIDVKSASAALPTAQAITQARAVNRVLITSFSPARRRATVDHLPGVATSASSDQVLRVVAAARLGLTPLVRRFSRDFDALQIPERFRIFRLVTPRVVRAMHACGVEVHVWTVNDPRDMLRLLNTGVDGLITDRCDLARELVDSRP